MDAHELVRCLGTSTYLMSPFEAGYEDGQHWRRAVKFRRDVYTDEREEIEKNDSPASDPFHPDPLDHRFLSMESNAYQHHFDIPFFKYLTPIHDDFKAAHRRKVSCRDQVLEAVIGVSLMRPYSCNTRILPYPAVSCRILSYPAVSCRILPYPAVSCRILPYPAVSCRICRILPYPAFPAVSCRMPVTETLTLTLTLTLTVILTWSFSYW